MIKLHGKVVSEKGAIVKEGREVIHAHAMGRILNVLDNAGFEYFKDQKAFALPYKDDNGNIIYATLTFTISTKAPNEKAKKSGTKKTATEKTNITIE